MYFKDTHVNANKAQIVWLCAKIGFRIVAFKYVIGHGTSDSSGALSFIVVSTLSLECLCHTKRQSAITSWMCYGLGRIWRPPSKPNFIAQLHIFVLSLKRHLTCSKSRTANCFLRMKVAAGPVIPEVGAKCVNAESRPLADGIHFGWILCWAFSSMFGCSNFHFFRGPSNRWRERVLMACTNLESYSESYRVSRTTSDFREKMEKRGKKEASQQENLYSTGTVGLVSLDFAKLISEDVLVKSKMGG